MKSESALSVFGFSVMAIPAVYEDLSASGLFLVCDGRIAPRDSRRLLSQYQRFFHTCEHDQTASKTRKGAGTKKPAPTEEYAFL